MTVLWTKPNIKIDSLSAAQIVRVGVVGIIIDSA